jgi:uncharacterized membrane protein (DUF4010 family)
MFETLHPFAISFFTGLLIGIERERAHAVGAQAIGVRTFVLLGLLGTLAATIGEPALTLGFAAFALAAILAGYFRSTRPGGGDIGLTTEVSAGVVFALGYLSARDPTLAASLGVIVLLVLVSRQPLHVFARETLQAGEVNAAVILLVFVFVVIPFLPDRTLDPWDLVNPQRLALMITIIAAMQFAGYVAGRVLGSAQGAVLTGVLGGLVSSTAVFLMLAGHARKGTGTPRLAAATALFATAATLVELVAVLFAGSAALAALIAVPVAGMVATGAVVGTLFARGGSNADEPLQAQNPLDVRAALRLGLVIGVLLIAVASAQRAFGSKGAQWVAMVGGLFELHGVSLATAVLLREGHLPLEAAGRATALAILASFLSKFGILCFLGRRADFALRASAGLAAMLAAGAGAWMLMRP